MQVEDVAADEDDSNSEDERQEVKAPFNDSFGARLVRWLCRWWWWWRVVIWPRVDDSRHFGEGRWLELGAGELLLALLLVVAMWDRRVL